MNAVEVTAGRRVRRPVTWILLLLLGVLALRTQFSLIMVSGESMRPTLLNGDLLVVRRFGPHSNLSRGDVVVAHHGTDLIVKRVVAMPGETVELRQGVLYVNEKPVAPNHLLNPGGLSLRKGHLAENRFAMLGDNRAVSPAESGHAVVPAEAVVGHVVLRLSWPVQLGLWTSPDPLELPTE